MHECQEEPDLDAKTSSFAFQIGDIVCFTNDYDVKWHGRRIIGLEDCEVRGRCYHLEPTDSPWFPALESQLTLEAKKRGELEHWLYYDGLMERWQAKHPTYLDDISRVIALQNPDAGPSDEDVFAPWNI